MVESLHETFKATFSIHENFPLRKRLFIVKGSLDYLKKIFTLRQNGSFKNWSIKGSLGNQNWFFYGITHENSLLEHFEPEPINGPYQTKVCAGCETDTPLQQISTISYTLADRNTITSGRKTMQALWSTSSCTRGHTHTHTLPFLLIIQNRNIKFYKILQYAVYMLSTTDQHKTVFRHILLLSNSKRVHVQMSAAHWQWQASAEQDADREIVIHYQRMTDDKSGPYCFLKPIQRHNVSFIWKDYNNYHP